MADLPCPGAGHLRTAGITGPAPPPGGPGRPESPACPGDRAAGITRSGPQIGQPSRL